ncbi:efflux RND transporter permease subunit [candidate division KSB1 bacterium]|nr:efflux RND transporter permease subunit [candidate division KSB1 bacterium]
MLEKIIEASIRNKLLVIILTLCTVVIGIYSVANISLDAIPDLSDVQVIILTEYPGRAPQIVEDQITYPLTTQMLSVPYAKTVRGYSFFGLSFVYIIFEDGTDMYWARSRVLEYLNFASSRLPSDVTPQLGPDATGVGWAFEYVVESDRHNLAELRSIQDWLLRYELSSVPGVAEVASIGGFVKQYQIEVDPNKLLAYNISLNVIKKAVQRNNNEVGGKLIELAETEFMVRGNGYITSIDDLKKIAVSVNEKGIPVLLRDIAHISLGPELRRGIAELNGLGETVGGIVIIRYGENALKVINAVKEKLEEIKSALPEGVVIKPVYDRTNLIKRAINNLTDTLTEEGIVVILVCIVFLLHFRSAFVAILALPLSILVAFIVMSYMNINANIMSLGGIAIAIGVLVDAAVVMIENTHKHIERDGGKKEHWQIVTEAAKEVGPALFYSLLIVTLSFIPVFTLQAQEGRLFKPLAFTYTLSLGASAIIAITVVPILLGLLIRGKIRPESKNPLSRALIWIYRPVIKGVLKYKKTTILAAIVVLLITIFPFRQLGTEFMPPLNEGDLLYMPTTDPGISITKARELLQQTDKIIAQFPEVEMVFGKIGRAETATDPAPLSMIETIITLKPEEDWRPGMTIEKIVEGLDKTLQFPGLTNSWTMPIITRIDMLSTGIKTPVGIKVIGKDLAVLEEIGKQIAAVAKSIPGTASTFSEKSVGGNYLDIDIDRDAISRYGLSIGDVQDVIQSAIGGMNISTSVEGRERYPINLRYPREFRDTPDKLKRILIPTSRGEQIPLAQLANISISKGPPVIKSENARPNVWVYIDIRNIDVGTYVKQAKEIIESRVQLPPGYHLKWSGQWEYIERANKRLRLVVPLTLLIIFILLFLNFKKVWEALLVMLSVPFSLVGGIWFMYFLDYNMSVAVWIGFLALAGLAAETGVVMILYIDNEYKRLKNAKGSEFGIKDVYDAVMSGAVDRVRPKMMTVTTTLFALVPILWSTGAGAQVWKRIAAPMIGGLITSTILTLIVIPVIYTMVKEFSFNRELKRIK